MTNEVIFDGETLSLNVFDGVMLDFSFFHFDRRRFTSSEPYVLDDVRDAVRLKVSVPDQVKNYGYKIDKDTLAWWESQPPEARKKIAPSKDDLKLNDFMDAVIKNLNKNGKVDYWWTRGNTFDPIFLDRAARSTGKAERLKKVLNYGSVRDTRTFIDAMTDFNFENAFRPIQDETRWDNEFVKHDSAYDIIADVLRMQVVTRAFKDMEPFVE